LRPSDLGAPAEFRKSDTVRFGEQADRPPELNFSLIKKAQKQMALQPSNVSQKAAEDVAKAQATAGARFLERQKLREERERFLKQLSASVDSDFGAANTEGSWENATTVSGNNRVPLSSGSAASKKQLSEDELERARNQAMKAYAALRDKRHLSSESLRAQNNSKSDKKKKPVARSSVES
jgi:hypothetical protein